MVAKPGTAARRSPSGPGASLEAIPADDANTSANYSRVSRSADSSERSAVASRQQQRGDSRLGSNAAQQQQVLGETVPRNTNILCVPRVCDACEAP